MTLGMAIGLLIVLAALAWALRPLWEARRRQRRAPREPDERLENLLFQRETLLLSLRDLRLDHEMGKLDDADFAALDAQVREQAVAVLRELDEEVGAPAGGASPDDEALERWIEASVAEVRSGARARQRAVAAEVEHGAI